MALLTRRQQLGLLIAATALVFAWLLSAWIGLR